MDFSSDHLHDDVPVDLLSTSEKSMPQSTDPLRRKLLGIGASVAASIGYWMSGGMSPSSQDTALPSADARMVKPLLRYSHNAEQPKPNLPTIHQLNQEQRHSVEQNIENHLFADIDLSIYPEKEHNAILIMAQALMNNDWDTMTRAGHHCPSFARDLQTIEAMSGTDSHNQGLIQNANRILRAVHTKDKALTIQLLEEYVEYLGGRKKFLAVLEQLIGLPVRSLQQREKIAISTIKAKQALKSLSTNTPVKVPLLGTLEPEEVLAQTHASMIQECQERREGKAREFAKKGVTNAHEGLIAFAVRAQEARTLWAMAQNPQPIDPTTSASPRKKAQPLVATKLGK